MRYEINTCEQGYEVERKATRETIAIFPQLKGESLSATERRAEIYAASLLRDGE